MSSSSSNETPTLSGVLAAYLEAVDVGQTPDREALLATHPDLAEDLRAFFTDHDRMNEAAAPVRVQEAGKPEEQNETFPEPFGDYELLEEIGRGGMGVVYKAKQISLSRIVALKRIRAGQLASLEDIARFQREAKAAAALDHPHIVPIYEAGEHEGQHYFTMKLIEGDNLNAHLSKFANDAKATAQVMIALARAVHHAHQRGILHRDLKPGNILIDGEGNPHLSDFGLAQPIEREAKLTQSGAVVGTPEYMAPEQAKGEKGLTTAADVYGLGAIFYVLLTGQPPFQGDYNWETLKKVVEEEPRSPRSKNRKLNRDLETICLKCLAKRPDARYSSAVAVFEDLERWSKNLPLNARREGMTSRLWKWMRREPAKASLALVMTVLLFSAAGLGLQKEELDRSNELLAEREQTLEIKKQLEESQTQEIAARTALTRQQEWSLLLEAVRNAREKGERGESLRRLKKLVELRKAHPEVGDPVRLHEEAFKTVTTSGTTLIREMAFGWIGSGEQRRLLSPNGKYVLILGRRASDTGSKVWCVPLEGGAPVSLPGNSAGFSRDGNVLVSMTDEKTVSRMVWDPLTNTTKAIDRSDHPERIPMPRWGWDWREPTSADGRWSWQVNPGHAVHTEGIPVKIADAVYAKSFELGPLPSDAPYPLSFHPRLPLLLTRPKSRMNPAPLDMLTVWDMETRREAIRLANPPFTPGQEGYGGEKSYHDWSDDGEILLATTCVVDPKGTTFPSGGFRAWRIVHPSLIYQPFLTDGPEAATIKTVAFSPDGNWLHADGLFCKVERTGGLAYLSKPKERPLSPEFDPGTAVKLRRPFSFGRGKTWEFLRTPGTGKGGKIVSDAVLVRSFPPGKEFHIPVGSGTFLAGEVSPKESYALLVFSNLDRDLDTLPFLHRIADHGLWDAKRVQEPAPWFELWDLRPSKPQCLWRSCFGLPDDLFARSPRLQPRFQEDEQAFSLFGQRPSEFFIPARTVLTGASKLAGKGIRGAAFLQFRDHTNPARPWRGRVEFAGGRPVVELEDCSDVGQNPVFWRDAQFRLFTLSGDHRFLALSSSPNAAQDRPDGLQTWIWDLRTGKLLLRWQPHDNPVTALAFSDDGSCLATAAQDGTLRLWNIDYYLDEMKKLGLPESWPAALGVEVRSPKVEGSPSPEDAERRLGTLARALEEGRGFKTADEQVFKLGTAAIPKLLNWLAGADAKQRTAAANLLGRLAPVANDARPALVSALRDKHPEVRFEAADALGELGLTEETRKALENLRDDPSLRVRLLVNLVITMHDAAPEIEPAVDARVRHESYEDLTLDPLCRLVRRIKDELRENQPRDVLFNWMWQLHGVGTHRATAVAALQLCLLQRSSAARMLGYFEDQAETMVPVLSKALEMDVGFETAAEICWTLEKFGPRAKVALPVLEKMALDRKSPLGQRARRAKAVLSLNDSAIPDLIEGLRAEEPRERLQAARALFWFGPRAKAAVPALREVTGDNHGTGFLFENLKEESISLNAHRALGRIETD